MARPCRRVRRVRREHGKSAPAGAQPEGRVTVPSDVLLTKAAAASRPPPRGHDRDQVADHLLHQGVRRLELVSWLVIAGQLVVWLAVNLLQGTLAEEFTTPLQWGFPVAVIAASLGIVLLIRSRRLNPATIVRFGLVYQVVISFGIAAGTYFGQFQGVAPEAIRFDRVGLTFVGPWIVLFSALVPAPPREALVALLASASAAPLSYLAQVPSQLAPALPAGTFGLVFVLPYLVVAGLSYLAARVVHRLGVEVAGRTRWGATGSRRSSAAGEWASVAGLAPGACATRGDQAHSSGALGDDHASRARFHREARRSRVFSRPTVTLYDFGSTEEGTLFSDGVLRWHRPRGAGAAARTAFRGRVIHILRQACFSLAEATPATSCTGHQTCQHLPVWRALDHDLVKLLDFGLVRRLASGPRGPRPE